ncbi:hypothetical protein JOQ06_008249 [Pogonophryne albipinna]|uniref:EF-hand domain-containing protein n=1 Tax=Pogonophryne albipinna TaxID=1090488 RepID=A0AAD6AKG7_9TELE|nr:hypothetical protein JOQ06_008249 [Pogonophryne albipinna]
MIHQQGSLMPSLLSDVFCQCQSGDTHLGVDPGGGHTEDPPSTAPRQPGAGDRHSEPGQSTHQCDTCGGPEQEHRLKVLFQVLDVNGDGGICVNDLTIGLKKLGVHRTEHELRSSCIDREISDDNYKNVIFGASNV